MQQQQMLQGFAALRARRAQGAPPKRKKKKQVQGMSQQGGALGKLSQMLASKPGAQKPGPVMPPRGRY